MTPEPISASTRTADSVPKQEYACMACRDTGWQELHTGAGNYPTMKRCVCISERALRAALPAKYHEAKLRDFSEAILLRVMDWYREPGDGLMIWGPTGSGKTHLAAAITRTLFEGGKKPVFLRAADLYLEVRSSYEREGNQTSETQVIGTYSLTPFLILDDIGSGSLSDYERRILLELLDRRGNALRPTVVTTNLGVKEITTGFDERVASRLMGYQTLALVGKDQRTRVTNSASVGDKKGTTK